MTYKAHAKVNIFLKIVGTRGHYHELYSRFMRVNALFDTLRFVPKQSSVPFELLGDFECNLEQNTLYKAFKALKEEGFVDELTRLMRDYALEVTKVIPTGAGLGGGSSDSATFLLMLNEKAKLGLTCKELMRIGATVGADVPFFVSEYQSANVSGIGEVVESFEEELFECEVFTPPLSCNTAAVYQTYRKYFMHTIQEEKAKSMFAMKSDILMNHFSKEELNDLYAPALKAYPQLGEYVKEGWCFSGSGSSFFKLVEKKNG